MLANFVDMRTTKVSAAEFQNNFGRYTDAAKQAPVVITRCGRDELVVLSGAEYARLRSSYRLANAPRTAEAVALIHLMDDDA